MRQSLREPHGARLHSLPGTMRAIEAMLRVLGHSAVYAVLAAFYAELFPTEVRYTGMSVGYQTAAILLAGFTPAIAAWLVQISGDTWPLVLIIVVTTVFASVAVLAAKESKDFNLDRISEEQAAQ